MHSKAFKTLKKTLFFALIFFFSYIILACVEEYLLQPLINYLYSPQKTDGSPIGLLLIW